MEEEKVRMLLCNLESPWIKESLRALRNKLVLDGSNHKVFCFSSLYPKEGVSTIVRMLASYLSDIQKKVIVVSADLKHKNDETQSHVFTLKDYLSGHCALETIVQNINDQYKVIIGSSSDEDHSDLLYLGAFEDLTKQFKLEYDYVLIDAPSFSIASETAVLSRLADSLILVVRENNVKISDFSDLYKKLQRQDITIKGVILNRVSETENLEITVI
jgi:polysaccharide biosynthesis transport protein